MKQNTRKAKCILCLSAPPIPESHIFPAFIVRWMKKNAPVNQLRWSQQPNKPEQDAWKADYLCAECEQKLSKVENAFKQQIYDHVVARRPGTFRYDESVGAAVLSLFFRHLQFAMDVGSLQGSVSPARLLDDLRLKLNATLNGGADWASLYALPLDFDPQAHRYGPGYNQYLLTLDAYWFDYCLPEHDPFWIGAVKLPLLQLVFSERPLEEITTNGSHRKELAGCRIEKSGAMVIPSVSTVIMELLGDNYVRRSAEIRGSLQPLSERQVQKIRDEISKHPDPYATVFHEAALADAQIAGAEDTWVHGE